MKGPESIQCTADSILSNPYAGIQFAFDKRRRNLEKRKSRLLQYEADLKEGKKLSEQQIEARFCIGEVETQLEFLKDISRILQSLQKEYLRGIKQRDDGMKKDLAEHERKRLEDFIYFQNVIERFGKVEVKDVFLNGTDNETKITEEECKVIEDLSEPFGLKCGEVDILMDFKKKCTDGSKLAHKILVGSKEKVMNDFSGFQIRELLEKIANSGHMRHSAKEKDQFVKSDEPALESVVEQPKKDPKVVFVHVANGSMENYAKGDMNQAGDTEFGFEGGIDPKALVRDPPPPIPFPAMAVPEDPTNTVSGPNHNGVWRAEAKPEVSSKRRSDEAQDSFINGVEQVNGFGTRGDERRQVRGAKGSVTQRNDFGNGGIKGGSDGERGRTGGSIRRQERDSFHDSRNSRGAPRNSGRGSGNSGGRGSASNVTSRGSGFRNAGNGNNSQINGGFKGNGNGGGGLSGYGYNGPPQPPRRQLGFNFASDF
uniref:Caprin-1_dimer domain-containing protein n=1 Tax=Onchocerca volvulus TaxID=6282 RepID=A0A8R1XXJ4_ONCVO